MDPRGWSARGSSSSTAAPSASGSGAGIPHARSPVSGAASSSALGFPFLSEGANGLGAAMQEVVERSLPPTPRSPSPTCSPPSSPKRQAQKREDEAGKASGELSAAEEDLETRAAALGLHEIERRVWRETALPPTPSSPSPTFSPPSSPKTNQRQAELALLTAEQAAVKVRLPPSPPPTPCSLHAAASRATAALRPEASADPPSSYSAPPFSHLSPRASLSLCPCALGSWPRACSRSARASARAHAHAIRDATRTRTRWPRPRSPPPLLHGRCALDPTTSPLASTPALATHNACPPACTPSPWDACVSWQAAGGGSHNGHELSGGAGGSGSRKKRQL